MTRRPFHLWLDLDIEIESLLVSSHTLGTSPMIFSFILRLYHFYYFGECLEGELVIYVLVLAKIYGVEE